MPPPRNTVEISLRAEDRHLFEFDFEAPAPHEPWLFDCLSGSELSGVADGVYGLPRREAETDEELRERIARRIGHCRACYSVEPAGLEGFERERFLLEEERLSAHAKLPTAWDHLLEEDGL